MGTVTKIEKQKKKAVSKADEITLNGTDLKIKDFMEVISNPNRKIQISSRAKVRVRRSRKVVEEILQSDRTAYGINTGFGRLADVRIAPDKIDQLQENLLLSHSVGVGPEFSPEEVRAIFLLRIQSLLQGHSGVREQVVDFLTQAFNSGFIPVVYEQGSCGASGDLAPLSHLALAMIGKGEARLKQGNGKNISPIMASSLALKKIDLTPLKLSAKEGLALINGTQVMTALGAMACSQMQKLIRSADIIGAMTLEALKGSQAPFHPRLQEVRPHPGQKKTAQNLLKILKKSEIMVSHKDCGKVQDAYSLRCMPQVHGACRDTLEHCERVIECEMNSVTDNPLIFPDLTAGKRVISGGNFHGQPVAQVLDFLAISTADLSSISERRIERLLNPDLSELPAFLAHESGLHSGFMMAQVTAASLVSESKTLSFPACVDSIPTSGNREDHVSMGTTSGRKLRSIIQNLEHVLAIELLCACKALEYQRPMHSGPGVEAGYKALRKIVDTLGEDRVLYKDIQKAREFISNGDLLNSVQIKIGALI